MFLKMRNDFYRRGLLIGQAGQVCEIDDETGAVLIARDDAEKAPAPEPDRKAGRGKKPAAGER